MMNSDCNVLCPFCGNVVKHDGYLFPGIYNAQKADGNGKSHLFPPELLYHYTKIDTLKEILKSMTLLGSHYSQLNDWEEINIGIEIVESKLKDLSSQNTESKFEDVLQKISDFKSKKQYCYVTSFSTQDDLLSQWRAYTDSDKGGIAIGFYSGDLHHFSSKETSFLPCSYTSKDEDKKLNLPSDLFFEIPHKKGEFIINKNLPAVIQILTTIKHYGYFEEQEWRLISVLHDNSREKIIKGKRYIEHKISKKMIREIIISPHGNQTFLLSEIEKLKNENLLSANCVVRSSKIPYRAKDIKDQEE